MKCYRAVSGPREKLKKLIEQAYASRLRLSQICAERFSQEHLIALREREVEELRAMAYLKVIEPPSPPMSIGEEERKNRVICALIEEKPYRSALTSISRCRLKINRLNAEIAVLEAGIKKAESETQLLFIELEK
jgi:hypothetical protein